MPFSIADFERIVFFGAIGIAGHLYQLARFIDLEVCQQVQLYANGLFCSNVFIDARKMEAITKKRIYSSAILFFPLSLKTKYYSFCSSPYKLTSRAEDFPRPIYLTATVELQNHPSHSDTKMPYPHLIRSKFSLSPPHRKYFAPLVQA